jgi:translation initiation factor IF-3
MEITGTLKVKFDTQKVSEKFSKREFVLTTEASTPYPQHISMQFTQDKCQLLDLYNIGDNVKVQINLRGREWNGPQGIKYFNTIEAWRIEKAGATAPTQEAPKNFEVKDARSTESSNNEDLPF